MANRRWINISENNFKTVEQILKDNLERQPSKIKAN
jgi:hypothetical protein